MEEKTKNTKQKIKNSRGFTLLLAALVASIALSLGSSIYSIVSKELALSSIGQDSQFAFYAADTAAECALYWDSRTDEHPNAFATSSASQGALSTITCDGQTGTVSVNSPTATAATSTIFGSPQTDPTGAAYGFNVFTDSHGGYCVNIKVGKSLGSSNAEQTLIIANGYNVSCDNVGTAQNALQRTVELEY